MMETSQLVQVWKLYKAGAPEETTLAEEYQAAVKPLIDEKILNAIIARESSMYPSLADCRPRPFNEPLPLHGRPYDGAVDDHQVPFDRAFTGIGFAQSFTAPSYRYAINADLTAIPRKLPFWWKAHSRISTLIWHFSNWFDSLAEVR